MLLVTAKSVACFLACFFNLLLCFKIFTRPIIHNIFNISLACLLGFHGIVGPLLAYFYFQIIKNFQFSEEDSEMFDQRFVCARFQELRILVLVAQQAITNKIIFRFFVIICWQRLHCNWPFQLQVSKVLLYRLLLLLLNLLLPPVDDLHHHSRQLPWEHSEG